MKRRWKPIATIGWIFLGMVIGWLSPIPGVYALKQIAMSARPDRVVETTILFQRLCTEVLAPTPLGRHYLDLGYGHWGELVGLLWYDAEMTERTWQVIDLTSPAVADLLEKDGSTVRVSQEMIEALLGFLEEMEERASPELRQIIEEERARVPWQELVGLTAEDAWATLQETVADGVSP